MGRTPAFFVFAGESSADSHGAALIAAFAESNPNLEFFGVAGPEMRTAGVRGALTAEDFSVMGFSDVLWSLPKLWNQFHQIRKEILERSPRAVIFIDSPSFSLRMARALRKYGYGGKIIQYISPTVWAWGANRVQLLEQDFNLLLTVYPFETAYYAQSSLKTIYVGNPVVERVQKHCHNSFWAERCGIRSMDHLVALFPGSRPSEISRNLPLQLQAIALMFREAPNMRIAISCAHQNDQQVREIVQRYNHALPEYYLIPRTYSYELMKASQAAIAKSGTVTLELALHRCPTVTTYRLTLLNRLIAKYVLKVNLPHYCIVNILDGSRVFPELIAERFTPEDICEALKSMYHLGKSRTEAMKGCDRISELLEGKASQKAAQAILNTL